MCVRISTAIYSGITAEHWIALGLHAAVLAGLAVAAWIGTRLVRRLRGWLEPLAAGRLGESVKPDAVRSWFNLLQRFASVAVCLVALWGAGHVVGLVRLADHIIDFVLYLIAIIVGARLLTLAGRALSRVCAHVGDQYLAKGKFKSYWGRVKPLLPFGERCFEAAVYVEAAALIVDVFRAARIEGGYGPPIVACIAIFFVTRVIIELAQVLIFEAFGLHKGGSASNQKGRTLVPLLHSTCQYVLYFGAGLLMLQALGLEKYVMPILAGAGILGLGVGLGAQSLVTDVVSGFFILFETQYLVGDYVQIGDAIGVVEAVSIRVTHVRDGRGKLYIIPNGQIKGVINFSKGFINAVVDVKVPTGADLEATFRRMTEAGRRLEGEVRRGAGPYRNPRHRRDGDLGNDRACRNQGAARQAHGDGERVSPPAEDGVRRVGPRRAAQAGGVTDARVLESETQELVYGAEYSRSRDCNMQRLQLALAAWKLWPTTEEASYEYGRLAAELRRAGRDIQQNSGRLTPFFYPALLPCSPEEVTQMCWAAPPRMPGEGPAGPRGEAPWRMTALTCRTGLSERQ